MHVVFQFLNLEDGLEISHVNVAKNIVLDVLQLVVQVRQFVVFEIFASQVNWFFSRFSIDLVLHIAFSSQVLN